MKNKIFYIILAVLLGNIIARAQTIKIMPGTTFKHVGIPYTIVLSNGAYFENNANVQGNNLVIKATGSGTNQIKGSGSLSIGQILMNKTTGQSLQLLKNVSIAKDITFSSGLLDLNGNNLLLADTALLVNESGTSHITGPSGGSVQIQANLNAPLAENPGNLGLVITSGANWGNTLISRSHNTFTSPGGGSSVARNYNIQPAINTALNAFLRMYYFDDEINALNETIFDFFQSTDNGAHWNNIGSVSRNVSQNFVNINGVQSMSLITLSTTNNPLPLLFTDLTANCEHNIATMQWRLPNPKDVASLQIEKSSNSTDWERVPQRIEIMSNVNYLYTFQDKDSPYSFYRLVFTGIDGEPNYSPVQTVNCKEGSPYFKLVQNPVRSQAQIEISSESNQYVSVQIFDIQGRLMITKPLNISSGNTSVHVDVNSLSSGMYHLRISNQQELLWNVKFVKQ